MRGWERSYPNAYAFDEPGQPAKYYEVFDTQAKVEFLHNDNMTTFGEVKSWDVQSTDLRYAYDRYTVVGGFKLTW